MFLFYMTYFTIDQPVQYTYVYYRHVKEAVVQCKGYHNIPSLFLKYCGSTTMSRHARKTTLFSNKTYLDNRYLSMRYDRIVIPGRPFVYHIACTLIASNCSHLLSPKKRIC